jgi:hypothetical protein
MAGRGPAPKDPSQRVRRNKTSTRMLLPAEGRKGDAPEFPLLAAHVKADDAATEIAREREADLWSVLWALPQAVAWEQLGFTHEVALYCRHMVAADMGDMDAAKEARMRSDRLGLTPAAMRSLQWEVVGDELAEKRASSERPNLRPVPVDDAQSG